MRQFVNMIISSAVGATIAITCLSKSWAQPVETRAREMLATGECSVEIGYPEFSVSDRCYNNKVMVGNYSGNIYCSTVTVTCN